MRRGAWLAGRLEIVVKYQRLGGFGPPFSLDMLLASPSP